MAKKRKRKRGVGAAGAEAVTASASASESASAPAPAPAPATEPATEPAPAPALTPAPTRRRVPRALILAALACVAVLFFILRAGHGRVTFAQGVELTGAEATREVEPGGNVALTLHFHVSHPLPGNEWIFVHLETEAGALDDFRAVQDQPPTVAPSQWRDQDLVHTVTIPIAKSAAAGRYVVYVGLYDRDGGERLQLLDPRDPEDRVVAALVDVVRSGADGSTQTLTASDVHGLTVRGPFRPLMPWLAAIALAAGVAGGIALWRRRPEAHDEEATGDAAPEGRAERWQRLGIELLPLIPFVTGILVVLEFVKDDAYISFRYAHNLVTGQRPRLQPRRARRGLHQLPLGLRPRAVRGARVGPLPGLRGARRRCSASRASSRRRA